MADVLVVTTARSQKRARRMIEKYEQRGGTYLAATEYAGEVCRKILDGEGVKVTMRRMGV